MSKQPDLLRVWENRRQLLVLELQCKAEELLKHMGGEHVAGFAVPFKFKDKDWSVNVTRKPGK